jgi:hypothetical protein
MKLYGKQWFGVVAVVLSIGVQGGWSQAQADYLDSVIHAGQAKRSGAAGLNLPGIQEVSSLQELDFQAGLDVADLATIESALVTRLSGRHAMVKTELPKLMQGLKALRSAHASGNDYIVRNSFVYFGASSGWILGFGGNVGLAFAKSRLNGMVAYFPILFARVSFVQFGSEAHLGLGVLDDAPVLNVNGGFQMGGAFFLGAGAGGGSPLIEYGPNFRGESGWVEFRIGLEADFGPYLEFMI